MEIYKVNDNLTKQSLADAGFTDGVCLRKMMFKDIIQLRIFILSKEEESYIKYEVFNLDSNTLYTPFYDNYFGGDDYMLKEVIKNFNQEIWRLEQCGIIQRNS